VSRQYLMMAGIGLLAAAGGYFAAGTLDRAGGPAAVLSPSAPAAETLVGLQRPDFSLSYADGTPVTAADFDDRPFLLNFWATWCAPCVEEMPMLAELQRDHARHGLLVVGVAVDEPERAQAFARELGLDYPLLFGLGEAMLVGRQYGNASGMLPYSVLVDAGGIVRWTHLGALDRAELEEQVAALR
jgi:thiol-disulfide isomerase/thioredoxin